MKILGNHVKREKIAGYCFILPAVIYLVLIVIFPLIYNVSMSFKEVTIATINKEKPFVGLSNYKAVFQEKVFKRALFNTFLFTIASLVFQFIIGFALALLYSKKFLLSEISRGLLMVCWLIPVIVFASIWKWIFAGDTSGILNYILVQLHLIDEPIPWLTSEKYAMLALIIANIWRGVPFNMLLLATGLTTLPEDVYESAFIEGATRMQRLVYITLPLLKPTIVSVITLGFIYTFKVFDLIFIMTGGGPLNSTHVLATLSYQYTFSNFDFAQGAAIANVMLIILCVIGCFYLRFIEKDEVIS